MSDAKDHFPDQSHIDQVRDALWRNFGNGASVMVGSGFSRCALKSRPGTGDPPLLPDLAVEIHKRLYPESGASDQKPDLSQKTAADRILSLAQEYETAFGPANLHQLLQQLIRDDDLTPGDSHTRLLQLPWRDVFTTNWDTLLERTRHQVTERSYSVIRDMDEIPLANRPRIVKLHGSLPAQFPLILTEEDYRTYPTKFAPFVNTVQQAMMETVFCLVGFSGNDPNFLNWSGWVRDNLGDSAPRIYLAGWLDLPHHRRRMLESRGVVPIDLAQHPMGRDWSRHLRHQFAIEWVLHTLERGRPYDLTYWPSPIRHPYTAVPDHLQPVVEVISNQPKKEPAGESNIAKGELQEQLREILGIWKHNRQLYPGWLLLPASEEREIFKMRTDSWEQHILAGLPILTVVERLNAIHELVWRREILLEPISSRLESAAEEVLEHVDCADRTFEGISDPTIDWSAVREEWRNTALALLRAARFRFDDELFGRRIEALGPFVDDHPDVYHRVHQERCLRAIYSLDFERLERLLEEWIAEECDPIWIIRKAALLWESDRNDEATELVKRALEAIRTIPDAAGSAAGASREGWALWSAFTMDNRQEFLKRWDELAALKCDAMLERDLIARQVKNNEESKEAPAFDLGIRRVEGVRFSSFRPELAAYRALLLVEVAGLPPATRHASPLGTEVASRTLESAAEVLAMSQPELAIRLALRVSNSETDAALNRVLSRSKAAVLTEGSVGTLSNVCIDVINYAFPRLKTVGSSRRSLFWITRMRVALEVLSRLALRATPDQTEAFLDIGLQCYKSVEVVGEHWLHTPVGNLLRRSWEALPSTRRAARAVDLLNTPITGMDNFSVAIPEHLPDPGEFLQAEDLPSERPPENDDQWRDVIRFLLRGLTGDEESRKRASRRILLMSDRGLLSEHEASSVAQSLWSGKYTAPDNLPAGTALFDWAFLLLPEPKPGMAEQRFRLKWLDGDTNKLQRIAESDGNTVSISFGASAIDPSRIEDSIWNVGTAVSGLQSHGRSLRLTDDERQYVIDLVELWLNADVTPPTLSMFQAAAREPVRWTLRGLASILAEGIIPVSVGERLYGKVRALTDSNTPCFELMLGLVKTIPDRFDELVGWLRMGLVSDDSDFASSAMSGLHSWMTASNDEGDSLRPPLDDMLREVGLIIASRRSVSLPHALQLASWVFKEGTTNQRNVISALVIQGLSYLAEELRYDREHFLDGTTDLPLLRWLCVQLAQAMAQSGFKQEPAVELWLNIGEEDPLPESRFAVTPFANLEP